MASPADQLCWVPLEPSPEVSVSIRSAVRASRGTSTVFLSGDTVMGEPDATARVRPSTRSVPVASGGDKHLTQ
jgi:hypothetical protein